MDKIERREKLIAQLKDKKYRDAFVSEHIDAGISFQIRALRKKRKWTQKELSNLTGMAQERISVAENPNYSRFNITTLKRIASAFDVAFIGRFVPISELVKWELNLSTETLAPVSFEEDSYFKPQPIDITGQVGLVLGVGGVLNCINPAEQSMPSQPFQPEPTDELSKYREAKQEKATQKELKGQLARFMKTNLEQGNETAVS